MDTLIRTFRTRLQNTPTEYVRDIHDKILWESRLVAILGARGVGKSTLVWLIPKARLESRAFALQIAFFVL